MGVRLVVRSVVAAALLAASLTVPAVADTSASGTPVRADSRPHPVGRWSMTDRPAGERVVWRSPHRVPTVDSRPEFRVGSRLLGYPRLSPDGTALSLPAAALGGADPADVQVWVGSRRLDSTAPSLPASPPWRPRELLRSSETPADDPGQPGAFAVESFDYTAADLPWPEFEAPMEVLGHAVLPVGVQDAPLVLFLHGRHIACYGIDDPGFWPCVPASQPVPSYLGYDYLQRMLASQGIATVSISANAVNAQDGNTNDGGAAARAALVIHHLRLIAQWSADPADARWGGRVDPDRVVLVGHSRGGEGVDQAAVDTSPSAPYTLLGQVLLAPTDFAYQTAPYLPTELLLGYCDGDVSDLQGQRYVDAAPMLEAGDPTLRSSVLLMGANHNYFNTEWTPGLSQAPSQDDWWDKNDPVCGRKASPTRLTAAEQRRAARTFVAAGVHAFLGQDPEAALPWLDAGGPVTVPAAGPAVALTHALGGHRSLVRVGRGATVAGAATSCRAGTRIWGRPSPALCGIADYQRQPHWTPAERFPASVHAAYAATGLPHQAELAWTSVGTEGGLALTSPLDLSAAGDVLDLRIIVDPTSGPVELQVVLGSEDARWAGPTRTLTPLPGSTWLAALWAQTVRVDPADYAGHVDLSGVDRVELRAVSATGRVWIADASRRSPGIAPGPGTPFASVELGRVVQPEGSGTGTAMLPFRVLGTLTGPARFAVAAEQWTFGGPARTQFSTVTVQPGQTSGTIPVSYEADTLDDVPRQLQLVHSVARRGIVTRGIVGSVLVRDDDPAPAVTFAPVRTPVEYGDDLDFRLTLSEPVDYDVVNVVRAVRGHGLLPPLRTSDVPDAWLFAQMGKVPDDVPLWRVWRFGFLALPAGRTVGHVVVPTSRQPLHDRPKVLTLRFSAKYLTAPLRAKVHVNRARR